MSLRTKIVFLLALAGVGSGLWFGLPWLLAVDAVEWGVMVDLDSDTARVDLCNAYDDPSTSRLKKHLMDSFHQVHCPSLPGDFRIPCKVKEPVLYFRSKVPLELGVHVGFPGGAASVSWPSGTPTTDGSLDWTLHLRPGARSAFDSIPSFYSYMHDPTSTTFETGHGRASFLFYEGALPKPPSLRVQPMDWSDSLVVANPFPYPIHDVCVRGSSRIFHAVSACFDSLAVGQSVVVRDSMSRSLLSRLRRQGLPETQARAMDRYWGDPFDREMPHRYYTVWSYRMPRSEIDARLPLTFSRRFVHLERWIYVYHATVEKIVVCDGPQPVPFR